MQKIVCFLLCIQSSFLILSQPRTLPDKEITVTGKVVDQASKTPLEYATIEFFSPRQKRIVGGGITDESGNFSIAMPVGIYRVTVGYISFEPKVLQKQRLISSTNLGTISLEIDSQACLLYTSPSPRD